MQGFRYKPQMALETTVYGKFELYFGQIQPPTLLAKLLVQSINIWDKRKRDELLIDTVLKRSTTLDRKRIYTNPSSYPNSNPNTNPNSNPNPKAQ